MENEDKPIDLKYPLLNDYVFKYVFSHKELQQEFLKLFGEFLNQSLIKQIIDTNAQNLIIAPNYCLKNYYGDILSILSGDIILSLEIYNQFGYDEYKKSLCYIARIYGNQLKKNEPYSNAKKVVGITLFRNKVDFEMDNILEEYKLTEQITRIKTNEEMTLFLVDIDKLVEFTYNKCERLRNFAILLKMKRFYEMKEYIKDKEDDMLAQTVAYVEEFLSDPDNQDLLGHHASDVKYAKLEGREEGRAEGRTEANKYTAINLLKAGIDKITIAKCIGLDVSDLDKLLISN